MMTFNEALKTLKQAAPVTLKVKTFRTIRVATICESDLLSCKSIFRRWLETTIDLWRNYITARNDDSNILCSEYGCH